MIIQHESRSGSPSRAQRPFTRAHNELYDRVKPDLYHKVDRSVLDAIIRRLEGYHQIWVGLTIGELAEAAGVSNWSTTKALGRLAAAEIILRRRRKLTRCGRFIWEIALSEAYRVTGGPMGPSHGTVTWDRPMPMKEKTKRNEVHHHASQPIPTAPTPQPNDDDLIAHAKISSVTPAPASQARPDLETITPGQQLPVAITIAAAPSEPSTLNLNPDKSSKEHLQGYKTLLSVGIDRWKARQLAKEHPEDLILSIVAALKFRVGSIRNPAAWIVRELERGGYSPPPQLTDQIRRETEQAERERRLLAEEARQAALERAQNDHTAGQLRFYHALPETHQQQLLDQVRERLRRLSPRLLREPLDLTAPGPVRSQLLELLEPLQREGSTLKIGTATPRSGGWEQCRREVATKGGKVST